MCSVSISSSRMVEGKVERAVGKRRRGSYLPLGWCSLCLHLATSHIEVCLGETRSMDCMARMGG